MYFYRFKILYSSPSPKYNFELYELYFRLHVFEQHYYYFTITERVAVWRHAAYSGALYILLRSAFPFCFCSII